jgi:hypothetical protein
VRSRERDGCLGGKLDLVRTIHGMYRRFGVAHHGGFPVSLVLIFGALFGGVLRTISWGFWWVSRMRFLCLFGW